MVCGYGGYGGDCFMMGQMRQQPALFNHQQALAQQQQQLQQVSLVVCGVCGGGREMCVHARGEGARL